jgi:hypothetical protein
MAKKRSPKYTYNKSDTKKRNQTITQTRQAINRTKAYKSEELDVKQNEYTDNLPKRPGMPKLPKLSGIKSKKVSNPSGLKGKIKDFTPKKLNVAKVYPSAPNTNKIPKPKTGAQGVTSTTKAPSVFTKKKGKK